MNINFKFSLWSWLLQVWGGAFPNVWGGDFPYGDIHSLILTLNITTPRSSNKRIQLCPHPKKSRPLPKRLPLVKPWPLQARLPMILYPLQKSTIPAPRMLDIPGAHRNKSLSIILFFHLMRRFCLSRSLPKSIFPTVTLKKIFVTLSSLFHYQNNDCKISDRHRPLSLRIDS